MDILNVFLIKIKYRVFVCLVISIFLVITSPLIHKQNIQEFTEHLTVILGFPISFLEQHINLTPDKKDFPLLIGFSSPLENFTRIVWGNFILSILSMWGILFLTISAVLILYNRIFKDCASYP